jgi:DNA-binding transcriptional LysR family regulator
MDWTHRIRLRNLKIILSLAQTRNLSHSAAMLNTTQPGLSKWLKDLEEDIGLPLFERHARGLRLTPHGEMLVAHARRIDAQLDRAASDMQALREGGGGRLVIGASGAAASETAPRAMLALLAEMPQLHVDFVEGTIDRLLNQLGQGDLDIVIGRTVTERYDESSLRAEVLYVEPIDLVARAGHPLFEREPLDWDEVRSYRWVVWPRGTPIRNAMDQALAAVRQEPPPDYVVSNSVTANITMLNNSDMIGTASRRATLMLGRLQLLRTLPIEFPGFGSVSMYWRRDELHPKAVEAGLACIRRIAGDYEA